MHVVFGKVGEGNDFLMHAPFSDDLLECNEYYENGVTK